jgi:D-xylose transport system ATP-binding protein
MSTHTTTDAPLFEARDVHKSFGAVDVLRGMSVGVEPGHITAIVGDNGAGKSTFIKCLTGIYSPDAGSLAFRGKAVTVSSPDHARKLGIETVYQDLGLVDDLPVWHNLHLNRELTWGRGPFSVLRRKAMSRDAARMLGELDVRIPSPDIEIRALSGGQRQAVAISRAVSWGPSLVIMDEPTAALGVRETAAVEELIGRLRSRGTSVLLISHDMPQVLRLCDTVTVLRHGRTVSSRPVGQLSSDRLVALITGASTDKEMFA